MTDKQKEQQDEMHSVKPGEDQDGDAYTKWAWELSLSTATKLTNVPAGSIAVKDHFIELAKAIFETITSKL